jgi:hypothetical protein
MNKSIFLMITFFAVLASSCKEDDKNTPALSGKWHLETIEYLECTEAADNRKLECGTNGSYLSCHDLTFSGGSTYTINYKTAQTDDQGQYTITGSKINFPSALPYEEYEFTLSGNTLVFINVEKNSDGCKEKLTYVKM